ncbi:MAG: SrtB family sortase, partial [Lachnospiraceae bacterium]|nr:SrtB family sortase [Lachnospiraceae bacterium]
MADFNVAGRQFRTQSDYNAALRDLKQIEAIKAKINMEQPGEVISLAEELKAGKYRLITIVGTDFKEEIQELADKYKKQGYTKDSKIKISKQKKKQAGKQSAKQAKNNKKTVSLEEYDEKMQQEIKAALKQRERKRKLIVALCSVVALASFGYYGVYYYYAGRTQSDYENLSELKGNDSIVIRTPSVTIHYAEEEEDIELTVLEKYEALYNKNKRLIGWLEIDGTNIDYPVMQTTNNEYYLDHNYNQEYDK